MDTCLADAPSAAVPLATPAAAIRLRELIAALSHALDITEGQPPGHCLRCCWIGMQVADVLGMAERERWELYYTLLLKDLGCSSNAARICELYLTDDLHFKQEYKTVGESLPQVLSFVLRHTGLKAPLRERFRSVMTILRDGPEIAKDLVATRCQRGADIARMLRFPEDVAKGIYGLDEHFDGGGKPDGVAGRDIPLYSRIALLAQVIDVFHTSGGRDSALAEARRRSGSWFDPELVAAFESVARSDRFWRTLASSDIEAAVTPLAPPSHELPLDEDYLDDIAAAFGQIVDSKSPYTSGHSGRVAFYTDMVAGALELPEARRRWLKRGALLHDIGKLGVSNSILDKPGQLDREEWVEMRRHAQYTEEILSRIGAFSELALVAGAHHEKLDGTGYPRGLAAADIAMETRIITIADIFDAITADRPYRGAIPIPTAMEMMGKTVGTAIDPDCFTALERALTQL